MRALLVPFAALALIGAADEETESDATPPENTLAPTADLKAKNRLVTTDQVRGLDCRDRISQARTALGKAPLLDRETASPDRPHLIYAVDRRQDGCSVMVMKGDPDDIRQLPLRMAGPMRAIPGRSAE